MTKKAGRGPREETRLAIRRARVMELFLEGFQSQMELASALEDRHGEKVSRATVGRDLSVIRSNLERNATQHYLQAIGGELARCDYVFRQARRGWERSIGTHRKKHVKTVGAAAPAGRGKKKKAAAKKVINSRTEQSLTEEELNGDPRYLDVMLRTSERRSKLMGLDAPIKIDDPRRALADLLGIPESEMPADLDELHDFDDGSNDGAPPN